MQFAPPRTLYGLVSTSRILAFVSVLVILLSLFSIFVSLSSRSRVYNTTKSIPARQVGLVLGTSPFTAGGGDNEYFSARMEGASDLYFTGKVSQLLLSGDNRTDHYNEPIKMKKALVVLGVPEDAITLDYAGRDTLDSVLRARDIFGVTDPIIITQRFHADRALFMARWNGMEAIALVVPDGAHMSVRLKLALREYVARSKMIFELVTGREPHIGGDRNSIYQ